MLETEEQIRTDKSQGPWALQICRCSCCSIEARCVPGFDFYALEKDPEGKLLCEDCFFTWLADSSGVDAVAVDVTTGTVRRTKPAVFKA